MTQNFQIGQRVSVIENTVKGTVIGIDSNLISIIDEDGFKRTYTADELIVYHNPALLSQGKVINKEQQIPRRTKQPTSRVIDLHYKEKEASQNKILEKQLRIFNNHLKTAKLKKQKTLVFIHGVGAGILRKKMEKILRQESITYCDAPYHKYGYGAIEVHL